MIISIVPPAIDNYGHFDPCEAQENLQNQIFLYVLKKIADSYDSIYCKYSREFVLLASVYPTVYV